MTLGDRIKATQTVLGMNAQQIAAELRITPEWLSKVVNNRRPGSDDLRLRLDDVLRTHGHDPTTFFHESSSGVFHNEGFKGYELTGSAPKTAPSLSAKRLVAEAHRHLDELIELANGEPNRLGWIIEELKSLVNTKGQHWGDAFGAVVDEVLRRERDAASETSHSPPGKRQEGAGL